MPLGVIDRGSKTPPLRPLYSLVPVCLKPLSKGEIRIVSEDVFDRPLLNPKYFSNKVDLDTLTRGARIAMRIARSKPLVDNLIFNEKRNDNKEDSFWLADANPDSVSDHDIQDWIRERARTIYHPVGTTRIASSIDEGVIDPQLCVHGVQGLRVADASVFPSQISGHPTATVVAVAEKAADMILAAACRL